MHAVSTLHIVNPDVFYLDHCPYNWLKSTITVLIVAKIYKLRYVLLNVSFKPFFQATNSHSSIVHENSQSTSLGIFTYAPRVAGGDGRRGL